MPKEHSAGTDDLGNVKQQILSLVGRLKDKVRTLETENAELRAELAQVYELAGPLISAVDPDSLQIETLPQGEESIVEADGFDMGTSEYYSMSDTEKKRAWTEKRSTVAAYALIG